MRIIPKNWANFQHYKDRNPPWIRLHKKLLDNKDFNALPPMACKVLVLLWLVASDTTDGSFEDDADALAFRIRLPVKDVASSLKTLFDKGFIHAADIQQSSNDESTLAGQIAKKNGFGSRHISDKTKRAVWERDHGKCTLCQSSDDIEFDHIHPVSKGGNSEEPNVQLLCRPCNRKKRASTAEQVATPAQPWLSLRTSETETETEAEAESSPPTGVDLFDEFWKAYPNKVGKDAARKAFDKRKVKRELLDLMLTAIAAQRLTKKWTDDAGQYIPNPATWINEGRWQDEGVSAVVTSVTVPSRTGQDPALARIEADRLRAVPIPANIREQLRSLSGNGVHA